MLLLITFSAEALQRGPRGKSPSFRLYAHKNDSRAQIIELHKALINSLAQDNLNGAKKAAESLTELATDQGKTNIASAANNLASATSLSVARDAAEVLDDRLDGKKTMNRMKEGKKRHVPLKFR